MSTDKNVLESLTRLTMIRWHKTDLSLLLQSLSRKSICFDVYLFFYDRRLYHIVRILQRFQKLHSYDFLLMHAQTYGDMYSKVVCMKRIPHSTDTCLLPTLIFISEMCVFEHLRSGLPLSIVCELAVQSLLE